MNNPTSRCRIAAAVLAWALLGAIALAQPVVIKYLPPAGSKLNYKSNISAKFAVGTESGALNITEEGENVTESVANGIATVISRTLKSTVDFNGNEETDDEPTEPIKVLYNEQGALTKLEESEEGLGLTQAINIVFSKEAVSQDSTWTYKYVEDASNGIRAGSYSATLVQFMDYKGMKCALISAKYADGDGNGVKVDMTAIVDLQYGQLQSADFVITGLPLGIPGNPEFKGSINLVAHEGIEFTVAEGTPTDEPPAVEEDEVAKALDGFTEMPGLFNLYRKSENGRDQIMLLVTKEQLNKWMFLQATAITGTSDKVVRGSPLADIAFKFEELQDGRITMVVPNYKYVADPANPISGVVQQSFSPSYLDTFDIEAESDDRGMLIDVSNFLKSDIIAINGLFQGGGLFGPGGPSYSPDRDNTFIKKIKNFPKNTVVETVYAFSNPSENPANYAFVGGSTAADPRSVAVEVSINIFELPVDNGFVPRMYDPRIGYFTTTLQDFTNLLPSDRRVKYILRWDLRKKDPSAALSEPVEPIVFWLDKGIPEEYRAAVAEGISCWNSVFEQIGFKNAVVVKQMTANDDFDHADMRYNTIQFVASEGDAYAVAQFRSNPMTGQILNAGITFDLNFLSYTKTFEWDKFVNGYNQIGKPKPLNGAALCSRCDFTEGAEMDRDLARISAKVLGTGVKDEDLKEYLHQSVVHTVAHEFGHILGLRHNFVASTQLSLAEYGDANLVNKLGTTSSVMDYISYNPMAIGKGETLPFYTKPGDYDRWAIKYGYATVAGSTPGGQYNFLKPIAEQYTKPGLAYRSDEVADSWDPYITRFDASKEPLDFYEATAKMCDKLIAGLWAKKPKHGESYFEFTDDFMTLVSYRAYMANQATRHIGGFRTRLAYRGIGDAPAITPISSALQRRAFNLTASTLLAEGAWKLPADAYGYLMPNPMDDYTGTLNSFPIKSMISTLSNGALMSMFAPDKLTAIVNAEYKATAGADTYKLTEHFDAIQKVMWTELAGGRKVDLVRQELQESYINSLINMGVRDGFGPREAKVIALNELKETVTALKAGMSRTSDSMTKMHYTALLTKAQRALAATEVIGAGGGPNPADLLQQLLGG